MIHHLKIWLVRRLPPALQHRLKKWYYPSQLRLFREEAWSGSAGVKRLVRPGARVVDAGANIGYTTWLLSCWVGPEGRVFGMEPVRETFDLLSHNMRRLGARNVQLYSCALSDREGTAWAEIPRYHSGAENFYESRLTDPSEPATGNRRVSVDLRRLDALIPEAIAVISFIKLDVEGHELPAVRGATAILERSRPAWFIEVSGDPDAEGSPAHNLFRLMARYEYGAYVYEGGRFRPRLPGERQVDYFFLTTRHLE